MSEDKFTPSGRSVCCPACNHRFTIDLAARFWGKVNPSTPDSCWEWGGFRSNHGYGLITVDGRPQGAHRIAYELLVGPIPEGLHIDHLCRNRGCVNPAHMEPVTAAENTRRSHSISAINATKTHCVNGHEFTDENTYVRSDNGARMCRACKRDRDARYRSAA